MNLTFMRPCEPAEGTPELAEWRVRNPNAFDVPYTVEKAGTGQILSGVAPAGDSFFTTPWGAQTLILEWESGSKTKAGGDSYNGVCYEVCNPDSQETDDDYTLWVNVGNPYDWGDWVDKEVGFCKFGSQDQERTHSWIISDKNTQTVCSQGSEVEPRTVEVSHCDDTCTEGNVVSLG